MGVDWEGLMAVGGEGRGVKIVGVSWEGWGVDIDGNFRRRRRTNTPFESDGFIDKLRIVQLDVADFLGDVFADLENGEFRITYNLWIAGLLFVIRGGGRDL